MQQEADSQVISQKSGHLLFILEALMLGWSFDLFLIAPFKQADRGLLLKFRINFTTKSAQFCCPLFIQIVFV